MDKTGITIVDVPHKRCCNFRNDDGCTWCEQGFIPSPKNDKSDCAYLGCMGRKEVKVG